MDVGQRHWIHQEKVGTKKKKQYEISPKWYQIHISSPTPMVFGGV